MAKKSSVEKNKHRERLVKRYAVKRARLKAVAENEGLPMEDRFTARLRLAEMPRNSSATRVRNRCTLTGRARAVYRRFRLSRMALRELASRGQIPGMTKASW
jgi:small subunit ribosomal protein S14